MSLKDPSLLRQAALVGTRWIEADGSGIAVKNPATGELVGYVPKLGAKETKEAIDAAAVAQKTLERKAAFVRQRSEDLLRPLLERFEELLLIEGDRAPGERAHTADRPARRGSLGHGRITEQPPMRP